MRTDSPTPPAAPADRLRAEFARFRRRLADRAPAWGRRWAAAGRGRGRGAVGLAAAAAVAAIGLAYYGAGGAATPAPAFVRSGAAFSRDDLIRIGQALDAKGIRHRADDDGRVQVAADRLAEADDALARLDVGPRPLPDIVKKALDGASVWDNPAVAEARQAQARNDVLAEMVRPLDGVAGANVWVIRPKLRPGQRPGPGATAFVLLETRDNRRLRDSTVQSIVGMVAGYEPDVRPDAVTIFDRTGHHYVDAHNPAVGARARDRARAEELGEEITEKLDWIKGVGVDVRLAAAPPEVEAPASSAGANTKTNAEPTATASPAPTPAPAVAAAAAPTPPPAPAPPDPSTLPPLPPAVPAAAVAVNRPLELPADEPETPAVAVAPAPTPAAAAPAPTPAPPPEPAPKPAPAPPPAPAPRARVWVKVPRSFYLRAIGKNDASLDELQPLVQRNETLVKEAVRHVVPPGQLGETLVSTIPDELPPAAPVPAPPAPEVRRLPWWVPAGVGVAAAAALTGIGLGVRLVAGRRPALRAATRATPARYKIDEAPDPGAGPGPSERVRELIRQNPEAAASVLHRWTGQGEALG